MNIVGITGGIGSGKSLICNIFKTLGIPVFNADIESKKLLETQQVFDFYYNEFGENILTNGILDKLKIAQLIFSDKEALQKVNSFIHPLIYDLFINWSKQQKNVPFVIEEAALLFESKSYLKLDYNILVCSSIETRVNRIMQRDNLSREQIQLRIDNQLPEYEKRKLANYVIENDNKTPVIPQVISIFEHIKQKNI